MLRVIIYQPTLQVLPGKESSHPSIPVAVGAVPGRRRWVLISAAVSIPASHSLRTSTLFRSQVFTSCSLYASKHYHSLAKVAATSAVLGFSSDYPRKDSEPKYCCHTITGKFRFAARFKRRDPIRRRNCLTVQYTPRHVTRDFKIITSTAFSKLYFFPDIRTKRLLFYQRNNLYEGIWQQLFMFY